MIFHTIVLVLLLVLLAGHVWLQWRGLKGWQECLATLARMEQALTDRPHPTARVVDRRPSVRIELRDEHETRVLGDVRVLAQARRPEMTFTDSDGRVGQFRASREEGGMFVYRRVGITP